MSLRIMILSDADSWINKYIPALVDQLKSEGHSVSIAHNPSEVQQGDLAFFLGCGQIVKKDVLKKNRHNLVVHESDLPRGKGWSPLTWQILEGKNVIPVCLFEATESVDNGKVYIRDKITFSGAELVEELRKAQGEMSVSICLRFVHGFPSIVEKGVEQSGETTFYKRRTKEDSMLDPDKTIREQLNLLRVVDNEKYPAFFEINGKKYIVKIKKAEREAEQDEQVG